MSLIFAYLIFFAIGFIVGWCAGSINEIKKHIRQVGFIKERLLEMRDQARQG